MNRGRGSLGQRSLKGVLEPYVEGAGLQHLAGGVAMPLPVSRLNEEVRPGDRPAVGQDLDLVLLAVWHGDGLLATNCGQLLLAGCIDL